LATVNYSTTPYTFQDGIFGQQKPSLTQTATQRNQFTYQASANYNNSFGKSNIGLLILGEAKSNSQFFITAGRNNYNLTVDELSSGSSSQADISNSGSSSLARQVGVVYRLTYDWAGKYLFEGSGRYDGHYYFAPGKRFGFFPAFSLGWRLSEENFIKNRFSWLDNFKIRGSYGEVGALAGSPFQYLSSYNINANAYAIDGAVVQSASERNEPNRSITWERAKKTNIGFESSFFKGMLTLDADYFSEKRSNMLVTPTVVTPVEYGINLSQVNAGKMNNHGIELALGSRYSFTKDFQVSLKGNLTFARNELVQTFETASTFNNPERRETGRPLGTQFGYKALGYWLPEDFTDPVKGTLKPGTPTPPSGTVYPGDLKYQDTNKDGKLNTDDYVVIGKPIVPELIYGILPGLRFKNFTLDAVFQGTGARNFNMNGYAIQPFSVGRGANKNNADFWRPDNLNAKFPRITPQPANNNTVTSSWWMFDAKYIRLKNIQLGYGIPSKWTQKIGVQRAMLNVTGQNVYTWTSMEYYDPETNTASIGYPAESVISVGLNVTFR
jgi:TonB-linked SusC/RagA family outer membrane protein